MSRWVHFSSMNGLRTEDMHLCKISCTVAQKINFAGLEVPPENAKAMIILLCLPPLRLGMLRTLKERPKLARDLTITDFVIPQPQITDFVIPPTRKRKMSISKNESSWGWFKQNGQHISQKQYMLLLSSATKIQSTWWMYIARTSITSFFGRGKENSGHVVDVYETLSWRFQEDSSWLCPNVYNP